SHPRRLHSFPTRRSSDLVRYDEEADVYFVGNFNGNPAELDNNGFISRLSPDGEILDLQFIAGGQNGVTLHAPRGMTIVGDTLWRSEEHTSELQSRENLVC